MISDYPTDEIPATPEYVFEVLREAARSASGWDDLTRDSAAPDLLDALDEFAWESTYNLAEYLNSVFRVDIPIEDWKNAFPRLRCRNIRDVCNFLASRITRPAIRPWNHIAGPCLPAGAFLTVRAMPAERGLNPQRITPSTPLAALSEDDFHNLYWRLTLIEPGRIPEVAFEFRHWLVGCGVGLARCNVGFFLLLSVVFVAFGVVGLHLPVFALGLVFLTGAWRALRWLNQLSQPLSVNLGELCTFRDLAYCLAGQRPQRRIQTTA